MTVTSVSDICHALLLYAVLPLWSAAGLADWWCHRRSGIERTAGRRENLYHLLLFGIMAIGAAITVTFHASGLVLVLLLCLFAIHEGVTWLELRFVTGLRSVAPLEQMVHSFLELLPLVALALLTVEWLAASADPPALWSIRLRSNLEIYPFVLVAAAISVANVAPLLEETWRCLHVRGASTQGPPPASQ